MKTAPACLITALLLVAAPLCLAAPQQPCPPVDNNAFPIRPDGKVYELSNDETTFSIDWTDRSGAQIGVGSVKLKTQRIPFTDLFKSPVVDAPKTLLSGGQLVQVCDFHQSTMRTGNSGEVNDLSVEAIVLDATTGRFETADIFEAIAKRVGSNVEVSIPDLYADTSGDGALGPGDLLYAAVDLMQFLPSLPAAAFGDHFAIVDGRVAGLPGMQFSSTPFSIDPTTGQLMGTPLTIDAVDLSSHQVIAAVPEPATGLLVAAAALGWLGGRGRERRRPVQFSL